MVGEEWVILYNKGKVRFPEKVMSHYERYKLLPCKEKLTVYRQTDRLTDRQTDIVTYRGASLIKTLVL